MKRVAPKRSTRSLVEAAFLAALTVVFCLATIYLLFWGCSPVFLAYSHCVTGCAARFAAIDSSSVVAGIIVAILAGPLTAISMFLGLGVLGLYWGRLCGALPR